MERAGVQPAEIQHAIFGNVMQTTSDAIYFARHVALKSGLPIEVPALTVNRLCGSGFEAVVQGAQQILLGESKAVLRGARWGLRLGPSAPLEDLLWESLKDPLCGFSMAETAENLAEKYSLSRND